MTGAGDSRLQRLVFDPSSTAWEKALRSGCITAFAAFWFILTAGPAAFGTDGGTWRTRLLETYDGGWGFMAMMGAPSIVVLLIACRLRRPALLACALAAAVSIAAFGAPLIIAPAVRIRQLHEGMVGVAIAAGIAVSYLALASLLIVLGAVAAWKAIVHATH